ncbi:nucleotidyl transferase AbiEii/AbiGii toxin family protein [Candidatus Gottesmanbacteria bacterium]|nr:nucleotidyl transferase AbiEii/AbiGii toxin family protein [Candidatus Gottesmanbacteria bacterium]
MGKTILTAVQQKTLNIIASDVIVKKYFYLSGGTALSEYYLHHRLSEDLDFFSETEIDALWLNTIAKRIKTNIGASTVDIQQNFNRNLIFFHVGKTILKTEFTYYPFTQIEKPLVKNILRIDSLLDIAVNKFFTIYQKPASRHFLDLFCILESSTIRWSDLSELARMKFDTVIDPLQLGSQLMLANTVGQLPHMILPIKESQWRLYFLKKAKELKKDIGKG